MEDDDDLMQPSTSDDRAVLTTSGAHMMMNSTPPLGHPHNREQSEDFLSATNSSLPPAMSQPNTVLDDPRTPLKYTSIEDIDNVGFISAGPLILTPSKKQKRKTRH